MSLLDDIGAYLQAQGIGTLGSTLFLSQLPESTSTGTVVGILESPAARPATRAMTGTVGTQAVRLEWPRIQIQARSALYGPGRDKITDVVHRLDNLGPIVWSGVRYEKITCLTRPARLLRRDSNDRTIFYAEFEIAKEPSS